MVELPAYGALDDGAPDGAYPSSAHAKEAHEACAQRIRRALSTCLRSALRAAQSAPVCSVCLVY
jgi:hypothetical protein